MVNKMSLFDKAINRKNKKINKYVKKLVRKAKLEIRKTIRYGKLKTEINIGQLKTIAIPVDLVDEIYCRTIKNINDYYNGEVHAELSRFGNGQYKWIKINIVKA